MCWLWMNADVDISCFFLGFGCCENDGGDGMDDYWKLVLLM